MSTATTNGKPQTIDPAALPLSPSETGSDGGSKGHGANGRFIPGNKCSKGNPFARRMAALRSAALEELTPDDVRALVRRLHTQALSGDVPCATLLLRYALGRPPEAIDPDTLDVDEWQKLASMPAYAELAQLQIDGVPPTEAIELLRRAKEKEPVDKEPPGLVQEVLAEREAHRRRRNR
jgi:hypothetical protein